MKNKFLLAVIVLFVVLTAGLYLLHALFPDYRFSVLESGNALMLLLGFGVYMMVRNQDKKSTGAFVRGVSGVSFLRLMVCMVAVLVYVMINRDNIHKPSVFVLMGIYLVYTAVETVMLSKLARGIK